MNLSGKNNKFYIKQTAAMVKYPQEILDYIRRFGEGGPFWDFCKMCVIFFLAQGFPECV